MNSRREFLSRAPLGAWLATSTLAAETAAPAAEGTDSPSKNPITPQTFAEAEKLMGIQLSDAEREMAARTWPAMMGPLMERRAGPNRVDIEAALPPASHWTPISSSGPRSRKSPSRFRRSRPDPAHRQVPARDVDIAFAPVTQLSRWIQSRQLSSERLTGIYLERIERFDSRLRCMITRTEEFALKQARAADREIAAGKYRGPLHGIPYGLKDLVDTAGIATTYGAEPFRDRIPHTDATIVGRLREAGAVLLGKLSMGALAMNDVWFGGQTANPWVLEEGSSGSSAGSAAATSAGLVAFAIGSETYGSIVSPCMRCGITGLRPTFGRVPRTGSMAVAWSLDKLGPMTRTVEDAMVVLQAISGFDPGDPASVASSLNFEADRPIKPLKVGYVPQWMQEGAEADRKALDLVKKLGLVPVEVEFPSWPYSSLNIILFAEAAASFEELTLTHQMDHLRVQRPDAWPNTCRQARFLSAVDYVQADRLRRKVAVEMARIFSKIHLLLVPSLREEPLLISNYTGHPSLTFRTGTIRIQQPRSDWAPHPGNRSSRFSEPRTVPYGVTLIGHLFDEGTIARVGMEMERAAGVWNTRPPGFE